MSLTRLTTLATLGGTGGGPALRISLGARWEPCRDGGAVRACGANGTRARVKGGGLRGVLVRRLGV